jgi:hypothetical protein
LPIAIKVLVDATSRITGSRHLICLSTDSSVSASEEEAKAIAARAYAADIAIHGIVPPGGACAAFLGTLCQETGGGFYRISSTDETPAILKRIQASILDRYEIVFVRTNLDAPNITLQIYSKQGYGETTTIASPPSREVYDS